MIGPHSLKSRRKISEARKRLFRTGKLVMWNKGKRGLQVSWCKGLTKDSDERLRQISESLMGHSFSPETIKKMQKKASTPERREWMRKIAADRVKK